MTISQVRLDPSEAKQPIMSPNTQILKIRYLKKCGFGIGTKTLVLHQHYNWHCKALHLSFDLGP